ncbi:conserved protein, unknown function [Plasmodium knowlesi strain H]|uniref:TMEM65 domain-containing protein n=2 Tax=Plasmodium knowlesi (strain H) TaxID=5851 RepID=A0A5E7X071_PLAKH|nr:TMEM65 domain-containing protein, putative [Plasmodium knowlesi strain H]CAA9988478.1 TMEM65 domain-containing protein, putative [Plasmodium knowlesi strain H]SBO19751.1 conserved protein, unknown function [Plasmodium knowlesi strain H]SBO20480.1 conserved protein, unknown function [Plasmodium knowlesi strain H]VVS77952.1 TMEM65 domain-containing protein, putative [Plasmodium knowlesi strain H]
MCVQHLSRRLSNSNSFFLQQKRRNLIALHNSAINNFLKKSLSCKVRFNQHHPRRQFTQLSNFSNLKKNVKYVYSFRSTEQKNVFLEKCFFHLTPKYHLQSQITRSLKIKQSIHLIRRKKRKEHRNYYKYGIAANHKNGNSSQSVFQVGEYSQQRNGRAEGKQLMNQNIHSARHTFSGHNITRERHTQCRWSTNASSFHTKIIKRPRGAKLRSSHLMGRITRRIRHVETSKEDGNFPSSGQSPVHLEQNTKARERDQPNGEDTYVKEKGASCEINKNETNPNEHVGNSPPKAQNKGDHTNRSKKNDKQVTKKGDYYSCKDAEKTFEEKSHEKGEMNIKRHDLILVALSGCIPFICFGFVDNSFMIIAGDLFDSTFCVFLGFSTLAAAGLGNLTSDVLGIFIGGYIEKIIVYIGFPRINLTNKQLKMNRTRRYYYIGSAIGIAVGCLLGMIPLLFIDSNKLEEKKKRQKKKKINNKIINVDKTLFQLVSTQLPNFLNSNYAFLFVLDEGARNFYSMVNTTIVRLPLDEDIIGHVYKKGKLINYESGSLMKNFSHSYKPSTQRDEVRENLLENGEAKLSIPGGAPEDCMNSENSLHFLKNQNFYINGKRIDVHQVIAAPVFALDESIKAVVVALNAKDNVSFSEKDAQFLSMFCSHISQELEEAKGLDGTLRLCKKIVYD